MKNCRNIPEEAEKERLEISPVDGELCVINRW